MARRKFRFPQPSKHERLLIQAAHDGDIERCREAIQNGANVNAVDHRLTTPLCQACWSNSTEIVRLLLEKGADANLIDGKTPLMEAAYRGNRIVIDLLIQAGGDIFARTEISPGAFIDLPNMARSAQGKDPSLEPNLEALIAQQRKINDGRRLTLAEVTGYPELDENGRRKVVY